MLSIGKLGASVDQLEDYERQVAQGIADYFSGRGEVPGRWIGAGCGGIGLSGRVDRSGSARDEPLRSSGPGSGFGASGLSRERLQGIALATRKAKEYGVDGARWQQEARARAAEHGFGQRELEYVLPSGGSVSLRVRLRALVGLAPALEGARSFLWRR